MLFTSKHFQKNRDFHCVGKSLIANARTDCTYSLRTRASSLSVTFGLPLTSPDSAAELSFPSFPSDRPFPNAGAQHAFLGRQRKCTAFQENRASCVFEGIELTTYGEAIQGPALFSDPGEQGINCLESAQHTARG